MDASEWSDVAGLAERIRAGSSAAEEELVLRFQARVHVLAEVRTRDPELARDLTQETLMAVIGALRSGQVQQPERLAGYILGVARNLVNNAVRGRSRLTGEVPDCLASPDPGPEESSSGLERQELASRAIAALGREDRRILRLSVVDGLSPSEIALRLGLKPDAVRQRKARALARARKELSKLSRS